MLVGQFGIIAARTTVDATSDVTGHSASAIFSRWKIFDPGDNRSERGHTQSTYSAGIPISANVVRSIRGKKGCGSPFCAV
jgi:hypothetical protein